MSLFSKRSHEGYFMVDQRASGVAVELPGVTMPFRQTMFEAATITCKHCQRQMIRNPERTRERGYCRKCDHYICDQCETNRVLSGGECKTFEQWADETIEAAAKKSLIL